MTNTREKLIELPGHLEYQYCQSHSITRENVVDYLMQNGVTVQEWIPASEPPKEHDSIWAKLYGTKSWQPGLFRKCSHDVLACVEKKDGNRRVISIRTYDGKWDNNKLNEETVICWQSMPQPPAIEEQKRVKCHNCNGTDEPEHYQNKKYCPNCGTRVD